MSIKKFRSKIRFMVVCSIVAASSSVMAATDIKQAVAALGRSNQGVRQQAVEMLLVSGNAAIPDLVDALEDRDVNRKNAAIEILGELKASTAVPKLIEELKSPNATAGMHSAFALGKIGDARAVQPLISIVESGDSALRGPAIIGLGHLRDDRAIPCLLKALSNEDGDLKMTAATALGMLGRKDGLDAAINGASSTNNTVRLTAIMALGTIGDRKAVSVLEGIVNDPKALGRTEAQISLHQIAYANATAERRLSLLKTSLEDKNDKVVRWAIAALADLGTAEAVALLREKAKTDTKEGKTASIKLKIMEKLRHEP